MSSWCCSSVFFIMLCCATLSAKSFVDKPNILVIVTDEEIAIPEGWKQTLEPWYQDFLPARMDIMRNGKQFLAHHTAETACVSARTTLYTGQKEGVTGISQTNGFAKPDDDPAMTWLAPNKIPTIGHWLLEAGFSKEFLAYFGKFHLGHVDLFDEQGRLIQTIDPRFNRIPENMELYRARKLLEPYGFPRAWVGPEPHGAAFENSGEYRDSLYVDEFKTFLDEVVVKRENGDNHPFVSFINLIQPHDIVLAWALYLAGNYKLDPNAPVIPLCEETDHLDLSKEPKVHQKYKDTYKKMYCWEPLMRQFYDGDKNAASLRQLYYSFIKKSDDSMRDILNALSERGLADNTIIIFTSDHGDLLGTRGGQWQKWHSLHKITTHVPLVVTGPGIKPGVSHQYTTHLDMVPTILGIYDIDKEQVREQLQEKFERVPKLPGKNLTPLIFGDEKDDYSRVIYTSTKDEISRGSNNYSATWVNTLPKWMLKFVPYGTYTPIDGARFVEAIRFYEENNGSHEEWSFMRYYDPDEQAPDEYRLYNVSQDPWEVNDLSVLEERRVEPYKEVLERERSYYHDR